MDLGNIGCGPGALGAGSTQQQIAAFSGGQSPHQVKDLQGPAI